MSAFIQEMSEFRGVVSEARPDEPPEEKKKRESQCEEFEKMWKEGGSRSALLKLLKSEEIGFPGDKTEFMVMSPMPINGTEERIFKIFIFSNDNDAVFNRGLGENIHHHIAAGNGGTGLFGNFSSRIKIDVSRIGDKNGKIVLEENEYKDRGNKPLQSATWEIYLRTGFNHWPSR